MFLAEPEIENIVFSDHKYHGDLLNLFTHEDSFFSAGKKKKDTFIVSILEGRMI